MKPQKYFISFCFVVTKSFNFTVNSMHWSEWHYHEMLQGNKLSEPITNISPICVIVNCEMLSRSLWYLASPSSNKLHIYIDSLSQEQNYDKQLCHFSNCCKHSFLHSQCQHSTASIVSQNLIPVLIFTQMKECKTYVKHMC